MPNIVQFYIDDSGTRRPDRPGTCAKHGHDWFALGGVMINEEDENHVRILHLEFCERWGITYPLHSVEIRGRNENFRWLSSLDAARRDAFLEQLYQMMRLAHRGWSCVRDRSPGIYE